LSRRESKIDCCFECGEPISEVDIQRLGGIYCKDCFMKIDKILREKKIRMAIELSKTPPFVLKDEEGKPFFRFILSKLFEVVVKDEIEKPEIEDFSLTIRVLAPSGLKRIDDLLGMAGYYYDAKYYWQTTPETVISAWNWFSEKIEASADYWDALEIDTVRDFLDSNWNPLPSPMTNESRDNLILYILSLIIDLYALENMGVDTTKKLFEIKHIMKNHIRKYEKLSKNREFPSNYKVSRSAWSRITNLRVILAHMSAEVRLARLAKHYGFRVTLDVHPDLIINDKKVDVKKPVDKYIMPKNNDFLTPILEESSIIENLSSQIEKGFEQNVDIVAIKVNHLDKRTIKGFKQKWLTPTTPLKDAIRNAINFDKKGIVLLFIQDSQGFFGRVLRCKKQKRHEKQKKEN
jgi:hypothetical protein